MENIYMHPKYDDHDLSPALILAGNDDVKWKGEIRRKYIKKVFSVSTATSIPHPSPPLAHL